MSGAAERGVAPPRAVVRDVYLRVHGAIACIAFLSLGWQIDVLYGDSGLLPVAPFLDAIRERTSLWQMPTILWWGAGETALRLLASAGVAASGALALGCAPRLCLVAIWIFYLSFVAVGRDFLDFQWDNLLLESTFFALFVAPSGWRLRGAPPPHRLGVFLMLWLVFRLHVESGAAKLLSGDPTWRDLTAMVAYYETAPLPTWVGWYAHQLPVWAHQLTALATLVAELAVPLLIWLGRGPRRLAFAVLASLQLGVVLTANYTFFNYLTLALCLFVLDDRDMPAWWRAGAAARIRPPAWRQAAGGLIGAAFVLLSFVPFSRFVAPLPALDAVRETIGPWRTINAYHLFASMTLVRREAVIEGSDDGATWHPYEFHYKPGDVHRPPAFVAPHQPRVDFRLWFLLLGRRWGAPYFDVLLDRILHEPQAVAPLFAQQPFARVGPRFVRVVVYRYRFTDWDEGWRTGAWWSREQVTTSRVRERR